MLLCVFSMFTMFSEIAGVWMAQRCDRVRDREESNIVLCESFIRLSSSAFQHRQQQPLSGFHAFYLHIFLHFLMLQKEEEEVDYDKQMSQIQWKMNIEFVYTPHVLQFNSTTSTTTEKNAGGRQCASSCLPFVVWLCIFHLLLLLSSNFN